MLWNLIDGIYESTWIKKVSRSVLIISLLLYGTFHLVSNVNGVHGSDEASKYWGAVFCNRCHQEEVMEWNDTAHAHAYSDPIFQREWEAQGSPDVCLQCHTTGFEISTGNFSFSQVSCEMCHGPGGDMNVNSSAQFCSRCHSYSHFPTYEEWLESEHSHAEVECVGCHDPMSLELKTEDTVELCLGCHVEIAEEVSQGEHSLPGESCDVCHMIKSYGDFENGEAGSTGHRFLPGVPDPDCLNCHDVDLGAHDIWGAEEDNCLTCHDPLYMTMLHLFNGTDVAMSESSILCQQCHNDIYYEWDMGIHADPHERDKECTDCHSPMNPYIMMNATLPPLPEPSQPAVGAKMPVNPVYFIGAIAVIGGASAITYFSKKRSES